MKTVQTFANSVFLELWEPDRGVNFNYVLPRTLVMETKTLAVLRDSLLMKPKQRKQGEFDSIFQIDPTISRVEYSLNKRHLNDYIGSASLSLTDTVDLFGSVAIKIRCNASLIGVNEKLTFLLSVPLEGQLGDQVHLDPVFTFYRSSKGGHIADTSRLDEFKHELILVIEL